MDFTPSDIESLSRSLAHWELAEYIFEALVIVACAGEFVADLKASWLTEDRKEHLQRRSTILLVAALSLSLICLVRTNELSGSVIDSLGDKAQEAGRKAEEAGGKAKTAINDSSTALSQAKDALAKAGKAEESLGKAKNKANKAQTASSKALILATDARREADSFEKDIKTAKAQAASAESHLAEALQKAADATRALQEEEAKREAIEKRLAPRSFSPDRVTALIKRLKQFPPQRVDIMTYPHDTEAEMLAIPLSSAFINAGWKVTRFEPMDSEGITGVFVEVDRPDSKIMTVAQSLVDGIRSPDLAVTGPASTLPREYMVGYTGPGTKPDAPIRVTIGSK
jgi:hypothetical protein